MPAAHDIVAHLRVGVTTVLYTVPHHADSVPSKTTIRGWRAGEHVMVDRPKADSGQYAPLVAGKLYSVRYVLDAMACTFDTQLRDWDQRQRHPYMRLEWPKTVKSVAFRRFERLTIDRPCVARSQHGSGGARARVVDMSFGGCSLQIGGNVPKGTALQLDLDLDGRVISNVGIIVRNVRREGGVYALGCEFIPGQIAVDGEIALFVTSKLAAARERPSRGGGSILVIDGAESLSVELVRHFKENGFSAVTARHIVDAFHHLRVANPGAIAINCAFAELPVATIIAIIRSTPGFERLRIFVYGGSIHPAPNDEGVTVLPPGDDALDPRAIVYGVYRTLAALVSAAH